MLVPNVEDAKITNEKIVFNDKVLPLKEEAPNLKLSTIENISEYSLETCIKTILEYNLDTSFHTIQYSKEKKKVYFYADKIISKKGWEDINNFQYTNLETSKDVLEEIKRLFNSEKSISPNHISLYNIKTLHQKEMESFCEKEKYYNNKLSESLMNVYNSDMRAHFILPPLKKNTINIAFTHFRFDPEYTIEFSKKNNNLFIKESERPEYNIKFLSAAKNVISEAYDELTKFRDLLNTKSYNIKPINSNFTINIHEEYVQIVAKEEYRFLPDTTIFSLSHKKSRYSWNDEGYTYDDCSLSDLVDLLKNNEDELFKSIFIRIDDCPKWMQEKLFCIRQNQLTQERQINENKEKNNSNKKTKKINLKRNLFPFRKEKKEV